MKRFLVACFSLLFVQNVSANASGMEAISRLTCVDASQSGIARQSWSPGGAPYGVPLLVHGGSSFAPEYTPEAQKLAERYRHLKQLDLKQLVP